MQCACVYGAGSPRGLCVCSGMFRASWGGSQSGPWPAGLVLCLRQGARVSLKRSRNSGGRAGGFRGPAVAAGAVLPCVRRLPCRRDRDRAVPVPPAPVTRSARPGRGDWGCGEHTEPHVPPDRRGSGAEQGLPPTWLAGLGLAAHRVHGPWAQPPPGAPGALRGTATHGLRHRPPGRSPRSRWRAGPCSAEGAASLRRSSIANPT